MTSGQPPEPDPVPEDDHEPPVDPPGPLPVDDESATLWGHIWSEAVRVAFGTPPAAPEED